MIEEKNHVKIEDMASEKQTSESVTSMMHVQKMRLLVNKES